MLGEDPTPALANQDHNAHNGEGNGGDAIGAIEAFSN
jgi:hypothetical protein